jgi:hypothetical protein
MPSTKKTPKTSSKTLKNLSPTPVTPQGPGSMWMKSFRLIISIISILFSLAAIIINISAILWIYKLENIDCKCSNNWMRTYIKYYLLVIIPIMVISILTNLYLFINNIIYSDIKNNLFTYKNIINIYIFFVVFLNIFGFFNIIISIIFINKLKEINCECSEDIKREVYYIYNIILASLICITILMFLMSIPIVILRFR